MSDKTKEPRVPERASQRGDTIISVLLSVIITSLVIVLAYSLLSRSLRFSQQARERDQVKNLIQSQIEGLKNLAVVGEKDEPNKYIFQFTDPKHAFCLKPNGTLIYLGDIDPSKPGELADPVIHTFPTSPPPPPAPPRGPQTECEKSASLASANVKLTITYDKEGVDGDPAVDGDEEHLFTITAKWDLTGDAASGTGQSVIPIRIHPLTHITP